MHAWVEPGAPCTASSWPALPRAGPAAATAPEGSAAQGTHEPLARAGPGHGVPLCPTPGPSHTSPQILALCLAAALGSLERAVRRPPCPNTALDTAMQGHVETPCPSRNPSRCHGVITVPTTAPGIPEHAAWRCSCPRGWRMP